MSKSFREDFNLLIHNHFNVSLDEMKVINELMIELEKIKGPDK